LIDLSFKYKKLLKFLEKDIPFQPDLSLVLGSGLGTFAENVVKSKVISTSSLPDYPVSTILGHKGEIIFSSVFGKNLLIFQGRIHFYETHFLSDCILPPLISAELGCKKILLTNAAGGINPNLIPGDLMLTESFNSISIKKELTDLIGLAGVETKNNFLNFPSKELNKKIKEAAAKNNFVIKEGIYWYTKGPSYETPAEIKMISTFGGDAVGMSTVHEAFFAASKGMEVASISCITNYAAGISGKKLNHLEVIETADLVKTKFEKLVKGTIKIL
jgi:purine-nucleoside phosphorylase